MLVGDVGLVAVDPDLQRNGIGAMLLQQCTRTMTELGLPFGFLTCGPPVHATMSDWPHGSVVDRNGLEV